MENEHLLEKISQILGKSRGEPAKLIEFIASIIGMNREGIIASYPKVVRRLWPEEWQQAEDKVAFDQGKWNLLRMRRREINERVFQSHLCFAFFIELSQEKQFCIINDPREIFYKRLAELEQNLAKTRPKKNRDKIKEQITELTKKFQEFEKGESEGMADAGGIIAPPIADTKGGRIKPWLKRWKWAAAGMVAVLVIAAACVVIWNLYLRPVLPPAELEPSDEPSIAVLPFKNVSEDPGLEYFCDGLTEGIITVLGRTPKMIVIVSASSFTYKGKQVNIQRVVKELNVQYVLQGSVQKTGDGIRISAQLIDATSGNQLWAERYDRSFEELFAVQDEITLKILTELQVKLTEGERIRLLVKGTDNLEAYLKFLQGYSSNWRNDPGDNIYARRIFQEAIALDPEYAEAYAYLAHAHLAKVRLGIGESRQKSVEQAFNLVQKALEIDESSAIGLKTLSAVYLFQGKYDEAVAEAEQAYALAPNNDEVVTRLGINLKQAGMPEKSIPYFEKALLLNPLSPFFAFLTLGDAYCDMGKYEMAIHFLEKALSVYPDSSITLLSLAICYAGVGKGKEAHASVERALKIDPKITIKKHIEGIPKKDQALLKDFAELLRKAGLPD